MTGAAAAPRPPAAFRMAGATLFALGCLVAAATTPLGGALGTLLQRAEGPRAVAPGTDLSLLLSVPVEASSGLSPFMALLAASLAGLGPLALLPFALSAPSPARPLGTAAFLLANPLTLLACASGHGFAAAGFFLLFSQMLVLPQRPPHLGMAPLGAGLLAAAVSAPGFSGFALPLFAVLFLIAPPAMAARHMAAVYLIAFLPFLAWEGALRYASWLTGAPEPAPLPGTTLAQDPFFAAFTIGTLFCLACAPGLLLSKGRKAGAAILLSCGLASTAESVPLTLATLAAAMAQGAAFQRFGGPLAASAGLAGAAALAWLTGP